MNLLLERMGLEWQFIGEDCWIFGEKVRGLVRTRLAEVYYDKGLGDNLQGNWRWLVYPSAVLLRLSGVAPDLAAAADAAEKVICSVRGDVCHSPPLK
jgi:hypothetical protein